MNVLTLSQMHESNGLRRLLKLSSQETQQNIKYKYKTNFQFIIQLKQQKSKGAITWEHVDNLTI